MTTLTALTATKIDDSERGGILERRFGLSAFCYEQMVFNLMSRYCQSYQGGLWNFYDISNGGFYMALAVDHPLQIENWDNGFEGSLSAEAASLGVNLCAYSHLSFQFENSPNGDRFADCHMKLFDFIAQHAEASALYRFVD